MYGVLAWRRPIKAGQKERLQVGTVGVQRVWIDRAERTPTWLVKRRVVKGAKDLLTHGITQGVYPREMAPWVEPLGLGPVSTLALRQRLAVALLERCLEEKAIVPAQATVALVAQRATPQVVQTLQQLALAHRHVLLQLPQGQPLCQQLRQLYGVAVQCNPGLGALKRCDGVVAFAPMPGLRPQVATYDQVTTLPDLHWPEQWPCPPEVSPLQGWAMVANTETWQDNWVNLALIHREITIQKIVLDNRAQSLYNTIL